MSKSLQFRSAAWLLLLALISLLVLVPVAAASPTGTTTESVDGAGKVIYHYEGETGGYSIQRLPMDATEPRIEYAAGDCDADAEPYVHYPAWRAYCERDSYWPLVYCLIANDTLWKVMDEIQSTPGTFLAEEISGPFPSGITYHYRFYFMGGITCDSPTDFRVVASPVSSEPITIAEKAPEIPGCGSDIEDLFQYMLQPVEGRIQNVVFDDEVAPLYGRPQDHSWEYFPVEFDTMQVECGKVVVIDYDDNGNPIRLTANADYFDLPIVDGQEKVVYVNDEFHQEFHLEANNYPKFGG